MKYTNMKKSKGSAPKGKKKSAIDHDPFFDGESKKRRKIDYEDDDIDSVDSEEDYNDKNFGGAAEVRSEEEEETVDEIRKRHAMRQLEMVREIARKKEEEEEEEEEERDQGEREGERDSLVAKLLQQEQLEESGRVRRVIASRVHKPGTDSGFRIIAKHRQSVTAVVLSEDDKKGFSASKDGTIFQWDVEGGKCEKYLWPSDEVLKSHGVKNPQGGASKHSQHILALAVSSDGRYLASGGLDRHVHLWDNRTREHIQAFPGHRGPVSCLTFRQGTSELFSGSFDRTVKIWNAEDRCYINTLFGHQSEILSIDCLRKERVLTVGRDRSMQLWKVPEESRLVFRAPASSLECCCFISNDEFLTGSDDGSVELWGVLRKKPVYIVKNAHPVLTGHGSEQKYNDILSNGHIENGHCQSESYHSSSAESWVSSVSVCTNSDLAASGAGNGSVHLWAIESETKDVKPLFDLPLVGFVNALAFAKSGKFLLAGVGQEPRLGRWGCVRAARNGVAIHSLEL